MTKRLPGHVQARTLNSIGHRVWQSTTRKNLRVDTKKTSRILKSLPLLPKQKDEFYGTLDDTYELIRAAKVQGWKPVDGGLPRVDFTPTSLQERLCYETLKQTIVEAYDGVIDYDDQIYMPTLFAVTWPKFPLVMLDEAQDISPLNIMMLQKLAQQRLIAVGDSHQSIYGFRGSVSEGMEKLAETFHMRRLTLNVSFRCPRVIVSKARAHAPSMMWPDWAQEGVFGQIHEWNCGVIQDGAAVICRNNAPLFKLGLMLLQKGRGVNIVGRDIGSGLTRIMGKFGPLSLTQSMVLAKITDWEKHELDRGKSKGATSDRAACLRVFGSAAENLGGALTYAKTIFEATGPITLLSGHKAKGLEYDIVYHLDPWRIPSTYAQTEEELTQEKNLAYVILTRAKHEYYELSLNTMEEIVDQQRERESENV
jgi:DNA helicase II / ATP-dependent DNA helicase PcrA